MKKITRNLLTLCMLLMMFSAYTVIKPKAAETFISSSGTIEGAADYQLQMNEEYYTTLSGRNGYVSFVTPQQEGYVTVVFKNISVKNDCHFNVQSLVGDAYYSHSIWVGNTGSVEYKSEVNNNNKAELAANTRYVLELGGVNEKPQGNVKVAVRFTPDSNPNGKASAEPVALNTFYTRSMDSATGQDEDYFKFTAASTGVHRFTLTDASCDGRMDYEIRKWDSDELVKSINNRDVSNNLWKSETHNVDMSLEKGREYYIKISSARQGNYTFQVSNQKVTAISVPGAITMKINDKYKVTPILTPQNAFNSEVTYESSDTDVASVNSNGEVEARSAGKAVITVSAKDGSGVKTTMNVYVKPYTAEEPMLKKTTADSLNIYWNAVDKASGYTVYQKAGNKWKKVGNTEKTSYTVKKLSAATVYRFRIRAYKTMDNQKFYSEYSKSLEAVTTPKNSRITKVQRKKPKRSLFSTTYRAKITWKKVKGATAYRLYYSYAGSSTKYSINTYKSNSATISVNEKGKRKFYVVAIKKYHNNEYTSGYSKAKTYKMR